MHVRERIRGAARLRRYIGLNRRRAAVLVIVLLVVGPLPLSGNVEVLVLNAVGLAWVGLLLLRLVGTGNKNRTTTRRRTR